MVSSLCSKNNLSKLLLEDDFTALERRLDAPEDEIILN
jgi:hypothetical protein